MNGEGASPLRAGVPMESRSVPIVEAPRETSTGSMGESLYRSSHFLIIISDY